VDIYFFMVIFLTTDIKRFISHAYFEKYSMLHVINMKFNRKKALNMLNKFQNRLATVFVLEMASKIYLKSRSLHNEYNFTL